MTRFWFGVRRNSPRRGTLRDLAQAAEVRRRAVAVRDAAGDDAQRQVPAAVVALRSSRSGRRCGRRRTAAPAASVKPARRSTSALNQSRPRSSMVYFSRARLRTARLPKSRCAVTTASATAMHLLGRDEADHVAPGADRFPASPCVAPMPPPTRDVVAEQRAVVIEDRDEAQVLREHVDVVVAAASRSRS